MVRLWESLRVDSGSYGEGEKWRHSARGELGQHQRGRWWIGAVVSGGRATAVRRECGAGFVAGGRVRGRCAAGGGTGTSDRAI